MNVVCAGAFLFHRKAVSTQALEISQKPEPQINSTTLHESVMLHRPNSCILAVVRASLDRFFYDRGIFLPLGMALNGF